MPKFDRPLSAGRRAIAAALVAATTALSLLAATAGAAAQDASRLAQNGPTRLPPPAQRQYPQAQAAVKVYLLRGFLNVFSLGMDDIAYKLTNAGISATVMNHADADLLTSRIVTEYNAGDHGPIVLIGHSLGADAIVEVADALARYNIPVALLVLFDGTAPHSIPPNVAAAVNYTKHFMIAPEAGARGALSNVDLSSDAAIDHLNIDTIPSLQAQTISSVMQVAAAAARPPLPGRQ